jgi:ribosome-associated toxin RatA of RatAB toxin-antitoxin module
MLEAERTWTVKATVEAVYAVIADVERYPDWHPFFATVDVLERDDEKRAVRATCTHPTPVATLTTEITFTYDPLAEVEARRAEGDLKDIRGLFTVKAQDALSVVTHRLLVDPGMRLGMLLRGPVEDRVRNSVLNGAESGLAKALAAAG